MSRSRRPTARAASIIGNSRTISVCAAHDAQRRRDQHEREREHDGRHARTEIAGGGGRQHDAGKGHQAVDDAHQHGVDAAIEAGEQPEQRSRRPSRSRSRNTPTISEVRPPIEHDGEHVAARDGRCPSSARRAARAGDARDRSAAARRAITRARRRRRRRSRPGRRSPAHAVGFAVEAARQTQAASPRRCRWRDALMSLRPAARR